MAKLTLDLHDIFNRGHDIDRALREVNRRGRYGSKHRVSRSFPAKVPGN